MRSNENPLLSRMRAIAAISLLALIVAATGIPAFGGSAPRTAFASQATPAAPPAAVSEAIVEFTGLVTNPGPVAVADLQALGSETVDVTYESGGTPEDHQFTGVRLYDALEHVGLAFDPAARNPLLTAYIVITANDGYQVVLSDGEIDPNFGDAPMLLAWEQDGAPLEGDGGPLRLVVPGDLRGGRYIHGIVSIDARTIEEAAS